MSSRISHHRFDFITSLLDAAVLCAIMHPSMIMHMPHARDGFPTSVTESCLRGGVLVWDMSALDTQARHDQGLRSQYRNKK
jgi:hypothetical protein